MIIMTENTVHYAFKFLVAIPPPWGGGRGPNHTQQGQRRRVYVLSVFTDLKSDKYL